MDFGLCVNVYNSLPSGNSFLLDFLMDFVLDTFVAEILVSSAKFCKCFLKGFCTFTFSMCCHFYFSLIIIVMIMANIHLILADSVLCFSVFSILVIFIATKLIPYKNNMHLTVDQVTCAQMYFAHYSSEISLISTYLFSHRRRERCMNSYEHFFPLALLVNLLSCLNHTACQSGLVNFCHGFLVLKPLEVQGPMVTAGIIQSFWEILDFSVLSCIDIFHGSLAGAETQRFRERVSCTYPRKLTMN